MTVRPRGPFKRWKEARSFTASDIIDIINGARDIPGFTHERVMTLRRQLGLNRRKGPLPEEALDLIRRVAAFDWCRHRFTKSARHALPLSDTAGSTIFTAIQYRHCPMCGCSETRMWTVKGYATSWVRPELPIFADDGSDP